jgi:hypothetical protein
MLLSFTQLPFHNLLLLYLNKSSWSPFALLSLFIIPTKAQTLALIYHLSLRLIIKQYSTIKCKMQELNDNKV